MRDEHDSSRASLRSATIRAALVAGIAAWLQFAGGNPVHAQETHGAEGVRPGAGDQARAQPSEGLVGLRRIDIVEARPRMFMHAAMYVMHVFRTAATVLVVTNEVGWGLVSEHRSGRVFTDLLGRVNAELAAASDDVVLVVAGRALHL